MARHINCQENLSLSELEWKPGELIAFDNSDIESFNPFILCVAEKIVRGFDNRDVGFKLLFAPENGEREKWTLYFKGNALALGSPIIYKNEKFPFFNIIKQEFSYIYSVEDIYSGRDVIQHALSEMNLGYDFYAECLKNRRLITERSRIEKITEKLGFGFVLPSQLRFQY